MLEQLKYPNEIAKDVAIREKQKRKKMNFTQKELSDRSGVSIASLKRFEQTGEISFVSLIKLADILGERETIEQLFISKEYRSIQEVINERNQGTHGCGGKRLGFFRRDGSRV